MTPDRNMDHEYLKDRLSAYHDGDLSDYDIKAVEEHLQDCEECRKQLEQLKKLDNLVEQNSQLGNEDYWERSAQRIEQVFDKPAETPVVDIRYHRWWGMTVKVATVAASIVMIAFVGLHEDEIIREVHIGESPVVEDSNFVRPQRADKITDTSRLKEKAAEYVDVAEEPALLEDEKLEESAVKPLRKEKKGAIADADIVQEKKITTLTEGLVDDVDPKRDLVRDEVKNGRGVTEDIAKEAMTPPSSTGIDLDAGEAVMLTAPSTAVSTSEKVGSAVIAQQDEIESIELDLEQLRQERDRLMKEWQTEDLTLQAVSQPATKKSKGEVTRSQADFESEKSKLDKSLLDTYYRIAKISSDDKEVKEAVSFIRKYSLREDAIHRDIATGYLKDLEKNQ